MGRFSIQNITQVQDNTDTYATEPVTVTELKDYLQLAGTAYDSTLTGFITAARQMIEQFCNASLVPKEIWAQIRNMTYKPFPLPFPPIDTVEAVMFKRCTSGIDNLVLDEGYFISNEYAAAKEIQSTKVCNTNQFFMVHYFTTPDTRTAFKQAILAQCGYMFNNRDSDKRYSIAPETEALIAPFKNNYF